MRASVASVLAICALSAAGQFPPIVLEWSAVRAFGDGEALIAHDPGVDDYIWSVSDPNPPGDELIYPLLPDGTDLAPAYPSAFSVGSLDHLVDMDKVNGATHSIIAHQLISGSPQDVLWHLDGYTIQSPDPWLSDEGLDLLVTSDAVYGCGSSMVSYSPNSYEGRVIKLDFDGNLLWDISWDASSYGVPGRFSSIAVVDDRVYCAALPLLVVFNQADGTFIEVIDISQGDPAIAFDAKLLTHGDRVYWSGGGHIGYFDTDNAQSAHSGPLVSGGGLHIAIDQYDHVWTASGNTWSRHDAELIVIDSGTLYAGINDLRCVNGKLSITGLLDADQPTTYVITGTPQP